MYDGSTINESTMEYERRISPNSLLFEARHELRRHLALETSLIEQIALLPEDDFCHHARESYQLGAGFAFFVPPVNNFDPSMLDSAIISEMSEAYFATLPRNRYLDEVTLRHAHDTLSFAAFQDDCQPDINIDPYELEALKAFAEGCLTVSGHLSLPKAMKQIYHDAEHKIDVID